MAGINVRIPPEAYKPLQDIAVEQQTTVGNVIAEWVKQHEEEQFWLAYEQAALEARNNPELWEQMQNEQRELDGMLMDGLE